MVPLSVPLTVKVPDEELEAEPLALGVRVLEMVEQTVLVPDTELDDDTDKL